MQLAARMQKLFITTNLPKPDGVHFGVLFQPAGYVSGDIYEVQQVTEGEVSFFVADVVGHGAPAALMTMFIKQSLQLSELGENGKQARSPADVLRQANSDILSRQLEIFRFATVICGTYNIKTQQLHLAHVGHPPPFLLHVNGEIETIEFDGPLLGIFEDEPFELTTLELGIGDRLLLYSDGFEVALGDPDTPMNIDYVNELHALRRGKLDDAMEYLQYKLSKQAGSLIQLDDLTVLIMDVTA
jgi:sigma-B regulation protein RsbU (phosphoserine phosphatase)